MVRDLEVTTNQLVARLEEYSPVLNTGLMDGRVQDAILKYPIIRCLNVPEADQEARRRCVKLMQRVVASATPVLPLILQDSVPSDDTSTATDAEGNNKKDQAKTINLGPPFKPMSIPHLSLETENRLMNYITALSEKEPLIHFWMNHHVEYQKSQANEKSGHSKASGKNTGKAARSSTTTNTGTGRKRRFTAGTTYDEMKQKITSINSSRGSNANYTVTESTLNLYIRLKIFRDIFNDLNDRVQGAICMVFWECWDEIYATLATIVGDDEMQKTDNGRLFRVSGDAALYIDSRRATKKIRLSERQRLAPVAEEAASAEGSDYNPASSSIKFDNNKFDTNSQANSSPRLSASPSSLVTDDSKDSFSSAHSFSEQESVSKQQSMTANSNSAELSNANVQSLQLIDSSELDFVFDDTFMKPGVERKTRSNEIDLFTTLHDVGDLMKSRVSSSTSLKDLRSMPVLDLRARIQMMEDGSSMFDMEDSEANGHAKIVW